jgi:ABC-type transport system involved in cytochrome bd biosynthesis fused ATPase/permease subunit
MAFHDLCRARSKEFPDIMVLDELLDSSVDKFGMSRIMDIIKEKQKCDNLKIYIISHRNIPLEHFDNIIVVEKIKGFSTFTKIGVK